MERSIQEQIAKQIEQVMGRIAHFLYPGNSVKFLCEMGIKKAPYFS
ncbi:hypothetical protein SCFA_3680005 [anaerobic digester metagenome]|uniref:Uncharacterized protein n=1 Tax=anaerobic digester metagenome TaxID=1263854 RepID=A0A485M723_9ZZZZ